MHDVQWVTGGQEFEPAFLLEEMLIVVFITYRENLSKLFDEFPVNQIQPGWPSG